MSLVVVLVEIKFEKYYKNLVISWLIIFIIIIIGSIVKNIDDFYGKFIFSWEFLKGVFLGIGIYVIVMIIFILLILIVSYFV